MVVLTEKLENLLKKKFEEEEYQHLFVVEIKQMPGDLIQVFIDSDEAVLFSHCKRMSRYLEQEIEEHGWLGEKYTLEVSSPGVGAPLKLQRQYVKNIGRTVNVQIVDDHKHIEGVLKTVTEEGIVVFYTEKLKVEGKKKKELVEFNKEIPFSSIQKTIVKISFR